MKKILFVVLAILFLCVSARAGFNATTLAEFRQDVKNNFLVMTDALYPDSVLDDFINKGCRAVASYYVIGDVDTVIWAANKRDYSLPENFLKLIAVFPDVVKGERAFDFIEAHTQGKIAGSTDLTASEYVWTTRRGEILDTSRIWFYPAPTAVDTLVLIYVAEAVELSAATDTTNVPYEFIEQVGMYATALCYAKDQSYNKASWWFTLFDQTIHGQVVRYLTKRYDYIINPKVIE